MIKTSTLKNVVKLSVKEPEQKHEEQYEPSAMVIANILNYSKALSVRRTKLIGTIDTVLN